MLKSVSGKVMLGMTLIVIAVLCGILWWDFQYQEGRAEQDLLIKAALVAKQQQASRAFIARSHDKVHGNDPEPIPPEEVGRGVAALFTEMANSRVKQTRLVVREGQNSPDEFERNALLLFQSDPETKEVFARAYEPDGTPVMRYIIALRADESCLQCHGEPAGSVDKTGHIREGMKEGDVAGAISVILPMAEALQSARAESVRLAAGVLILTGLTLILIWVLLWRQVSMPMQQLARVAASMGSNRIMVGRKELDLLRRNRETSQVAEAFAAMSLRLQSLYDDLEQKVADRTAALRRANAELARTARNRSDFLTMITHEFRTPLTSIMTFTELLLGDKSGSMTTAQREHLTDVLESSQRLMQLSNDLLDLSRLDAGKIKLFREVFPVEDLVGNVLQTVRPLAEKKRIELTPVLAPDLPLLHADGLRCTQVLMNLVSNAIKFTPEDGTVTVWAQRMGDRMEIAVSDTGIGIPEEEQERIFEAFQQAGRRSEGSGLGLALARSLVELHGGRLLVESRVGHGSTFRLTLPLWSEEE